MPGMEYDKLPGYPRQRHLLISQLADYSAKIMTGSDPGPGALPEDDVALATAEEILGYAEEEFRKAVKTGDIPAL